MKILNKTVLINSSVVLSLLVGVSLIIKAPEPFAELPNLKLELVKEDVKDAGSESRSVLVSAWSAQDLASQQKGLMFIHSLPENQGMLFDWKTSGVHCMWMKNTKMDIDVAFIDENNRIINIEEMKENTTTPHCSSSAVPKALEMEGGWFKKNNVTPGYIVHER